MVYKGLLCLWLTRMRRRSPKPFACGWIWKSSSTHHLEFGAADTTGLFSLAPLGPHIVFHFSIFSSCTLSFCQKVSYWWSQGWEASCPGSSQESYSHQCLCGKIRPPTKDGQEEIGSLEDTGSTFQVLLCTKHCSSSSTPSKCIYWAPIMCWVPTWLFNIH